MKNQITEKVYNLYMDGYFPEKLKSHIEWLQSIYNAIPEEHRHTADVCISAEYDYAPTLEYDIRYTRPETDEEEQQREAAEAKCAASRERKERATYEQLKQKYGA